MIWVLGAFLQSVRRPQQRRVYASRIATVCSRALPVPELRGSPVT